MGDGDCRYPCLNDGKNSDNDRAWDTAVRGFLNTFFPNPSPFEK
jgi:hypothetical protein